MRGEKTISVAFAFYHKHSVFHEKLCVRTKGFPWEHKSFVSKWKVSLHKTTVFEINESFASDRKVSQEESTFFFLSNRSSLQVNAENSKLLWAKTTVLSINEKASWENFANYYKFSAQRKSLGINSFSTVSQKNEKVLSKTTFLWINAKVSQENAKVLGAKTTILRFNVQVFRENKFCKWLHIFSVQHKNVL